MSSNLSFLTFGVAGIVIGGSIEFFMIKTGFYKQLAKDETEKRQQIYAQFAGRKAERLQRLKDAEQQESGAPIENKHWTDWKN